MTSADSFDISTILKDVENIHLGLQYSSTNSCEDSLDKKKHEFKSVYDIPKNNFLSTDSFDISTILEEVNKIHYPSGLLYQRINSCKALLNKEKDELVAIHNLVETHSPGLRFKTALRYESLMAKEVENCNIQSPLSSHKDNLEFNCSGYQVQDSLKRMLEQIEEMPKEWTLIQMTPQYDPHDNLNENNYKFSTKSIHISVFYCGQNKVKPFLVTANAPCDPVNGTRVELTEELMLIKKIDIELLESNGTKRTFANVAERTDYRKRKQSLEDRLRALIKDLQDLWLKEWRCLLTGKYCDESLELEVKTKVQTFFKTETLQLDEKNEAIMCCLVKSCIHLKLIEIRNAIQKCFPHITDKKIIRKIVHFVRHLGDSILLKSVNTKRHPVILLLHDELDYFPWEMIDVLQDQPVSRLPSLHFLYCLFKEHQRDIVDGHKIVTNYDKGAYIVNPDKDLAKMEVRLMTFFNYWTPNWTGTAGYHPEADEFFELLTSADIFSYNGHGSGSHLMSSNKIQRTHVKAVVFLFGCSSTKSCRIDPQVEMWSRYHMYLVARCPCVVGMLWEVTDTDTDVLTTDFISYWIPSKATVHWKYVDKTKWKNSIDKLSFINTTGQVDDRNLWEPELLRAINMAKKNVSSYKTKAGCVVRGLPVKIQVAGAS